MSCALCSPLRTPVLDESEHWRVALNMNQSLLGKTIVVLARHEEDVTALVPEEWETLHGVVARHVARLRAAFAPEHVNYAFLQNQDRHVHLHVIPRYASARMVAGVAFDDPDWPGHCDPARQRLVDAATLDAIAARLYPEAHLATSSSDSA
jgi:diadenosine tetraphosphate (Ap4A) HIT family hydrolase